MLRKCQPDPEAIVQWYDVPIQYDTTYEEVPIQILDRKMKSLRQREIPLVKVLWQHHGIEEATWELETTMQERYPYLFISWGKFQFQGQNFLKGVECNAL